MNQFMAETITKTFNDGTEYITYKAVGEEIKNSDIDNPWCPSSKIWVC